MTVSFVDIEWGGRMVRIEHAWLNPHLTSAPLVVFLHEGLGSVGMWKTFPAQFCDALRCRGLVYSRPGYGRSTPRASDETWQPNFMHRQACEVLPQLLQALGVNTSREPPWLFGHSDGASIALLHAAHFPLQVAGLVALAPHTLVEDCTVASIEVARTAYLQSDLRQRLARYHDDPDSAFWGWCEVWLSAGFRDWTIQAEVARITCPVLAVQGLNDEYGTLEQIHSIARALPLARLLELPDCGHSAHRDQPQAVIAAVQQMMAGARC